MLCCMYDCMIAVTRRMRTGDTQDYVFDAMLLAVERNSSETNGTCRLASSAQPYGLSRTTLGSAY